MAGFKLAFLIAAHSEGEEARKLKDFRRVSRQWKMVLGAFTLPGPKRYNLEPNLMD